jgi:hypothetical protein
MSYYHVSGWQILNFIGPRYSLSFFRVIGPLLGPNAVYTGIVALPQGCIHGLNHIMLLLQVVPTSGGPAPR